MDNTPGPDGVKTDRAGWNQGVNTDDSTANAEAIKAGTVGSAAMNPTVERTAATTEMKGLRATLMTDLDAVRARLKDGTVSGEKHKADQDKAADLAQGLERVDRALAAMDGATDATWADMREQQLKEVADVRTWLNGYQGEATGRK